MGKKIVMLSRFDFAGSGYRIAEAINLNSNNFVDYFVMFPYVGTFTRRPAFVINDGEKLIATPDRVDRLNDIIASADIIHFKGDFLPSEEYFPSVILPKNIPIIITVGGSFYNRLSKDVKPIAEYLKICDLITAITPNINYPEAKGIFTQHAFPTHKFKNEWKRGDKILIAHSPTYRITKGTRFIIEAVNKLKSKYNISLDMIENVCYSECRKRKKQSTIFFEQIGLHGICGNSAIESMAMGIPTIGYISPKALEQSDGKWENIPVVNSGNTVESLTKALEIMINSDLTKLSQRTKKWCDDFYSYKTVGKMWSKIYETIYNR